MPQIPDGNIGRISGPLLSADLLRQGVDLAFETDLLYLDVNNKRIGIKTDGPTRDLLINNDAQTFNLVVDNYLDFANLSLEFVASTNTIRAPGDLTFTSTAGIFASDIKVEYLDFNDNVISTYPREEYTIFSVQGSGGLYSISIQTPPLAPNRFQTGDQVELLNRTTSEWDAFIIDDVFNTGASALLVLAGTAFPDLNSTHYASDLDNVRPAGTNLYNLEFRPNGSGELLIYTPKVTITGNLHSTGNITIGGNVVIGTDENDNVVFKSDVASNIIPYVTETYSLGSRDPNQRWLDLYTELHNGSAIQTGGLDTGAGINLALRQGKIWYVATNGLDTNQGNHPNGPYATIAKALSQAQTGDTIHVFPGTYVETFPLTVPQGVTVTGTGLRAVLIKPTEETKDKDGFLLNGETTVENVTVQDFYYNSIDNTGYAFRFADNFKVTRRSPYVRNCSVITTNETNSAGRGALADGSVADSTSIEASLLFHGVTLITPGADALTMTNGVRVEWLNSFTYFADHGLYALEGELGFASQGVKFGAELRSIGSANVYGTYGATAMGPHTLMYLINHNFGYIGSGTDTSNDTSLVIQENETVELGGGRIYYQSMDQTGDFRVGDTFHADFQTGLISINGISTDAGGISSINFADEDSETNINAVQVNTGNIKFSGNTISSLYGPVNLVSATGDLNFTQNVAVTKNAAITGDVGITGKLTIGNLSGDIVDFEAPIQFDLRPSQNQQFSLGTTDLRWLSVFVRESFIDDTIKISTNSIETLTTNTDLQLGAITGAKVIVNDSTTLEQNLTVNTTTTLQDLNVTGLITHVGNVSKTGDTEQTGNINQTGNLTVSSTTQFDDVQFNNNNVNAIPTAPATNLNLVLKAAGTGKVRIPQDNVLVEKNVTVGGNVSTSIYKVTTTATADSFSTGDILIEDNLITTTIGNNDLLLEAAGTGKISVPLDNVTFEKDLTVLGTSSLKSVNVGTALVPNVLTLTGDLLQTGAVSQTGDRQISNLLGVTSDAYFKDIDIINNTISTKGIGNVDLVLEAAGTGKITTAHSVQFDQTLKVTGTTYTSSISNSARITSDIFTTGDINAYDNVINTGLTNSNLILNATNTSKILSVPLNNVTLGQNLTVLGTTNLANTVIVGDIGLTGALIRTGAVSQTGAYEVDNLSTNNNVLFSNISIIDNRISTRTAGSDLDLRAVGTGKINVAADNVYFNRAFRVDGILTTSTINNTASTTTSDIFKTSGIEIDNNFIRATVTDSNLILSGNGTGGAKLEKLKFNSNVISTESNNDNIIFTPGTGKNVNISSSTAIKVPVGTTLNRPTGLQGDLRFNTDDSLFGGWSTVRRTFGGVYSADRKTHAQAHPTNNTISFVANLIPTMDVLTDRLRLNGLTVDSIQVNNNVFAAVPINTDLIISANGTGNVITNKIKFDSNMFTNLDTSLPLVIKHTADGHLTFGGTYGIVVPSGDTSTQPANPEVGDFRFNTETESAEIWDGTKYIPITGTGDIASAEIVTELGDIWSLILG